MIYNLFKRKQVISMKKLLILIVSLVAVVTLSACNGNGDEDGNVVFVTVYPMQYLVEQIAGDTVEVKRVPGAASHSDSIDWSAKEIIDMLDADLLFYIHAGVDDYIPNNEANIFADGDVQLFDMSQHIQYNLVCFSHEHHDEEDEEHTEDTMDECDANALSEDPHFWLDPVRMLEAAEFVRDKLLVTYPDNTELYNNNYTVLRNALEKLDLDYQTMADQATKPIITTVMLFEYWHDRYELEIMPITNDAHSTETNPGDIIDLINDAIEHDIQYVLFEKNSNSPAGQQVLEDLQVYTPTASAAYLHGLGNLTQAEIDAGSSYLSIMYDNLDVLNDATK